MLNKLSFRNAKRQFKEYILYFVTLACTVSIMYAFNTLIFSDVVKELSSFEILPYMITAASLLIVIIMGWIISYMTGYMLRKRSREFSIYMISGISNSSVNALVFRENILIGLLAFLIGLPIGILLSQLFDALVFHNNSSLYLRFAYHRSCRAENHHLPQVSRSRFFHTADLQFTCLWPIMPQAASCSGQRHCRWPGRHWS